MPRAARKQCLWLLLRLTLRSVSATKSMCSCGIFHSLSTREHPRVIPPSSSPLMRTLRTPACACPSAIAAGRARAGPPGPCGRRGAEASLCATSKMGLGLPRPPRRGGPSQAPGGEGGPGTPRPRAGPPRLHPRALPRRGRRRQLDDRDGEAAQALQHYTR